MPTTWTAGSAPSSEYVDGDPYSLWDAHDWNEFNWDGNTGSGTNPTWTAASAGSTTWS
jgi:hypothetical protein